MRRYLKPVHHKEVTDFRCPIIAISQNKNLLKTYSEHVFSHSKFAIQSKKAKIKHRRIKNDSAEGQENPSKQ